MTVNLNKYINISETENIHIVKADCIKYMQHLGKESFDVIVTSPPYNIGLKYGLYSDKLSSDKYLKWLEKIAENFERALKPDGSLFLNIGGTNVNPTKPFEVAQIFQKYFKMQNNIVWVKSISIDEESYGPFKPINSNRFLNNNFEYIFHFSKKKDVKIDRLSIGVPFKYKSNIKRFNHSNDKRCAGNVWFIPYKAASSKADKFFHPCTFPVILAEKCIKLHGIKNNLSVYDPFMGTGSTLLAAKQLGVIGHGTDIDEVYCINSVERLKKLEENK